MRIVNYRQGEVFVWEFVLLFCHLVGSWWWVEPPNEVICCVGCIVNKHLYGALGDDGLCWVSKEGAMQQTVHSRDQHCCHCQA